MQIINGKQAILDILTANPYDESGNKQEPQAILQQLKIGEIAALTKEDEDYFLYQRRGRIPFRYRLTERAPLKTETVAKTATAASNPQSEIVWRGETISSEDPNALALLESKLMKLQQKQERMKQATKLAKKGDRQGLSELGYSPERIERLIKPEFSYYRVGHQAYELSNNNQTIRQVKERIKELARQADWQSDSYSPYPGLTVEESVEHNRIRLLFNTKPSREICKLLKTRGFKWSPTNSAWQRMLNVQGKNVTEWTIQSIKELNTSLSS